MKSFIIQDGVPSLGDDAETAHARLRRLLGVSVNSLYGYLDEGSRVEEYYHMKGTANNAALIITEVRNLIAAYEPNIDLVGVAVTIANEDGYGSDKLTLEITYEIGGVRSSTLIIK